MARNKYTFDNTTFYVSDTGNGTVSGNLVWISKFYKDRLRWNKGFKPEKVNEQLLNSLS